MSNPESAPGKHGGEDEKKQQERRARHLRVAISYFIATLISLWLFQMFVLTPANRGAEISYSEFKEKLADHQLVKVSIGETSIDGEMKNPKAGASPQTVPFHTLPAPGPAGDPKLIDELQEANVTYQFAPPPSAIGTILLRDIYLTPPDAIDCGLTRVAKVTGSVCTAC
jgi:ATP-dependent Zn protease